MLSLIVAWWKERLRARREAVMFERQVHVTWDEAGVSVRFPTGEVETISWAAVATVAIETNDSGPWGADVWWLLEGAGNRLAYPQAATGDEEMLEELPRRFPGFSDEAVIRAMGCTDNARFVCWERPDGL
jgi:hypothetical protein